MKIYRGRPKRKTTAQLAWDYFTSQSSVPIREMFYDRQQQRWIADFGFVDWLGGYCGGGSSSVNITGGWYILDAETNIILEWAQSNKRIPRPPKAAAGYKWPVI